MSNTRSSMLPDERRRLIAVRLRQHGSVSVSGLEAEFRISPMTARRDLDELERRGMARRTHGGAVLPGLSSHEDSFLQRLDVAVEAKERLAEETLKLIEPGEAVFVDSSTTAYITARRIVRENLQCTLLTNSVPIMQLVCELDAPQVELIGAGGTLRKPTRSFVGPHRAVDQQDRLTRAFDHRPLDLRLERVRIGEEPLVRPSESTRASASRRPASPASSTLPWPSTAIAAAPDSFDQHRRRPAT